MGRFQKLLKQTVASVKGEPTDSEMFGVLVQGGLLRDINETGVAKWVRKSPGTEEAEATAANFPAAHVAGRELARRRYAERLSDSEPITREGARQAVVALGR